MEPQAVTMQAIPTPCSPVNMFSSSCILLKNGVNILCLSPNDQGYTLTKTLLSITYVYFLIHTTKGWCRHFMSITQCSGELWPTHRKLISSKVTKWSSFGIIGSNNNQPTPTTPCSQVDIRLQKHTTKAWCKNCMPSS